MRNRRRPRPGEPAAESAATPETDRPSQENLAGQLTPGAIPNSGLIKSEAGRYLWAVARDDAPAQLGTPVTAIDDTVRRVWEIAFGRVARRRFEPGVPLAELSRTVATAVHEHAIAALPMLEAEMLVRAALKEPVPTDEIEADVVDAVHLLLFASLADELALGDTELEILIAEAEAEALAAAPVPA